MDSKCYLHDFNSYLQFVGLLSLIIILFIAVLYYLRVYHNNILEKYDEGSIDIKTIESKTGSLNNRSTYPKDKYPGRNMNEISGSTDTNDKYTFRDCKVYFTESKDKIDECDRQSDNMKKCSYTFDGWKEFATYTDNYGNIIDYPKKHIQILKLILQTLLIQTLQVNVLRCLTLEARVLLNLLSMLKIKLLNMIPKAP